jgi:chromosome segregation ATPase
MDLQQELESLRNELKSYKEFAETLGHHKTALDRKLLKEIQGSAVLETECVKNEAQIKKLESDISVLKQEKELLQKECDSLKQKFSPFPNEERVIEL